MNNRSIREEYFNWLYGIVCKNRFSESISYKKMLQRLFDTEFNTEYLLENDNNRAVDGIGLRTRFAETGIHVPNIYKYIKGPCSVLEMMVALALRCEENIMTNTLKGDRTQQWFWYMISSLGLGYMRDERYDEDKLDRILHIFMTRKYAANGRGGLFLVYDSNIDMRKIEIWSQMHEYLTNIT